MKKMKSPHLTIKISLTFLIVFSKSKKKAIDKPAFHDDLPQYDL